MLLFIIIIILLSLLSTSLLLMSPYLRITSLGWFIGIWCIPIFGALFFLLTVVRNRVQSENSHFCELKEAHKHNEDCMDDHINCLGVDHGFLPYFYLKDYSLLRDDEFVPTLHSAIDNASKRIWITTYIFSGNVGDELLKKLIAAHERGVKVYLLIDRVGSGLLFPNDEMKEKFANLPFQFSIFRESAINSVMFLEKRLHSKIVVIDDDTAFIGAHNLRDEILSTHEGFAKNASLKFSGSVVHQLEAVFADLWLANTKETLSTSDVDDTDVYESHLHDHENEHGNHDDDKGMPARVIYSDPIAYTHTYDQYLMVLLMAAQQRIYVWMPYVIPTQTMRNTLIAKHKMGLDIKILVPGKSDSALVDNSHQLVLHELFDNGIQCAESTGDFDHSKVLIIDNVVILGSTNLDFRSLYRNYEANIEVNDEHFAEEIVAAFDTEYEKAKAVTCMKVSLGKKMINQFTSLIAGLY